MGEIFEGFSHEMYLGDGISIRPRNLPFLNMTQNKPKSKECDTTSSALEVRINENSSPFTKASNFVNVMSKL
jgi:hypothetical protein